MYGEFTDTERLEWVIKNRNLRTQGADKYGWCVLDCRNGLTFIVNQAATFRDAIDRAMIMDREGKIRQ